jgi:hypothetical protein
MGIDVKFKIVVKDVNKSCNLSNLVVYVRKQLKVV